MKHTIRLDPKLDAWVAKQVANRRFKDFTHAVEYALSELIRSED